MAQLQIKPVNHGKVKADKNRYCGPSAISAITGMTTGEAARLIRHVSGKRKVTGTSTRNIREALKRCNVISEPQNFGLSLHRRTGPTLAGWLKATVKERTAKRVFLIVSGWHWQVVQGRRIVCGILKEPTSVRDKRARRRARVAEVYELFCFGKLVIPEEARKPKRVQPEFYREAQKLCKEHDIDIEINRLHNGESQKWIGYEDVDENGEDIDFTELGVIEYHCCYEWWEVCDAIESIAQYRREHGYRQAA